MLFKMFKWLFLTTLKIIVGIFIFGFISLVILFSIIGASTQTVKPVVNQDSYLVLKFPNGLNEIAKPAFDYSFNLNDTGLSFYRVLSSVDYASHDMRIKGIIIDLDSWFLSAEQTAQLDRSFAKFKATNRKVYGYGNYLGNHNYRIALSADSLFMPPSASAMVSLTGYSRSFPYYKNLGDKIGVEMQVIHIGDYKSFGENYSKNKMSDQFKSEITKIYDFISADFNSDIVKKRGIDSALFNQKLYNGEYAALDSKMAKDLKLIDGLKHYTDLISSLNLADNEDNLLLIDTYAEALKGDVVSDNKIALLVAEGDIVMSSVEKSPFDEESYISPKAISSHIKDIMQDDQIKAVVLRINSGGGSALASEIILSELNKLKAKKPVVVSMGSVAASGGYYIASGANKIFAEKNTITGSIGVVGVLPNVNKLTQNIGVNFERISKGKYSDLYDITKPVNQEEIGLIRNSMQRIYVEFKKRVTEGRGINDADLEKIAQGRIWTGSQAKELKLVDEIGGINEALLAASELAKVTDYSVEIYPKEETMLEKFMQINPSNIKISTDFSDLLEVAKAFNLEKSSRVWEKGALMVSPFQLEHESIK